MRLMLRLGSGLKLTGAFVPTLRNLFLSANSVLETVISGTTVGALTFNQAAGSTLSLIDNAGGRFVLSGTNINTVTLPDVAVSTVYKITVQESNAGFAITSRLSDIYITVLAEGAAPTTLVSPGQVTGDAFTTGILYLSPSVYNPDTAIAYQWVSGATEATATTPIVGATGTMYEVNVAANQYVRCRETPANGEAVRFSNTVRIHSASMAAPILTRTSLSGAVPFTYTTQYPDNTTWADDIEHVQYASNQVFSTILWDASRGLTEASFVTPFTSDETIDADPAWDVAPPVFSGTYYVRRKAIAAELLGGAIVESPWSEVISNLDVDQTVRIDPVNSWKASNDATMDYTYSNNNLSFTSGTDLREHIAVVNFSRTGNRTAEVLITALPDLTGAIGLGFDDGVFDWATPVAGDNNSKQAKNSAFNGGIAWWTGSSIAFERRVRGVRSELGAGYAAGFAVGDKFRISITQGTFTGLTPNDDGVILIERVRAGVKTTAYTQTGISSFNPSRLLIVGTKASAGTIQTSALTPAIAGGSQEYQT